MKTKVTSLMALLMAVGMSSAAFAADGYGSQQEAAPGTAPAQTEAPAADFSDQDLQKFAAVQDDLEEIRGEYSARLESTEDPDKAAELQQEASQMMVQVVQDVGMNVETYSNIALALQTDAQLRDKVQSMMN